MFPYMSLIPYPYPFNVQSLNSLRTDIGRIFLEKSIKLRKDIRFDPDENTLLRHLNKLGKWVEEMKIKHTNYELEDTQLIFQPSYKLGSKKIFGKITAKIIMKENLTQT